MKNYTMATTSDQSAAAVIRAQAELLRSEIAKLLPHGTAYALVDFPSYSNVGDSAIWIGGLKLLTQAAGQPPRYVCDNQNFRDAEFDACHPDGPIFIIGGGNFGDLWPKHQIFREMLLQKYPGRLVVQLPQTINFRDMANAARCAKLIAQHGNFKLMVRDRSSLKIAQEHLRSDALLLPDLAFGMGLIEPPTPPRNDVFMLLREDTEKAEYDKRLIQDLPDSVSADWLDEPGDFFKSCEFKTRFDSWGRKGSTMAKGRIHLFKHLSHGRLDRGLRMLSSGRVVITDRLHAHILCTLLDKSHVVLDNNYGKIFSYMDVWTHSYQHLRRADSAQEAVSHYHALLRARSGK